MSDSARRSTRWDCGLLSAFMLIAASPTARGQQQPTSEQARAIRESCRGDYQAGCAMMKRRCRQATTMLGIGLMLASTVAEAQWVLVARRAIGRVEQMSQSTPGSSATLDTSAVIIDAPADKVYATFVRKIRAVPDVTVAKEDEAAQTMQFTNGVNTASIKVNVLGDGLAHVMVSATNSGPPPAPMTTIVDHILAACRELNVECQRGQQ